MREILRQNQRTPSWFFARDLEYLEAAAAAGVDPDRWEELSDDAKGLILARYRAKQTMSAWEEYKLRK